MPNIYVPFTCISNPRPKSVLQIKIRKTSPKPVMTITSVFDNWLVPEWNNILSIKTLCVVWKLMITLI